MSVVKRIVVYIPVQRYEKIRRRSVSSDDKTSRKLSRYLFTFLELMSEGEELLYQRFTRREAKKLVEIIHDAKQKDKLSWEELSLFSPQRLCALVQMFNPCDANLSNKISQMTTSEIIAFSELVYSYDRGEIFTKQISKFVQ